jgi:hypothetical protein
MMVRMMARMMTMMILARITMMMKLSDERDVCCVLE